MDSLTMASIVAALLSYQLSVVTGAATGGGPVIPDVALQFDGTYWTVVEGNTETPDAYYTITGGNLFIDDTASSGEPISVVGGSIFVGT